MQIRILVPGPYMTHANRAAALQAGDTLDTKDWYAESLIASGLAERVGAPAPVDFDTQVDSPAAEPPPFTLATLPHMTEAVLAELSERGVTDLKTLGAALEAGTLKNVPGVGAKTYQSWKKAIAAQE